MLSGDSRLNELATKRGSFSTFLGLLVLRTTAKCTNLAAPQMGPNGRWPTGCANMVKRSLGRTLLSCGSGASFRRVCLGRGVNQVEYAIELAWHNRPGRARCAWRGSTYADRQAATSAGLDFATLLRGSASRWQRIIGHSSYLYGKLLARKASTAGKNASGCSACG